MTKKATKNRCILRPDLNFARDDRYLGTYFMQYKMQNFSKAVMGGRSYSQNVVVQKVTVMETLYHRLVTLTDGQARNTIKASQYCRCLDTAERP